MKDVHCDPYLIREIKKAAGKTKTERIAFTAKCGAFAYDLGKAIKNNSGALPLETVFDQVTRQYPREVYACSVAASVMMREGMSSTARQWARDVLAAWNAPESHKLRAYIDDNLHSTRLEEYAGSFIRCNIM